MTNAKTTKRALFASAMSMLLCVSMLIGSTFAWFTDSATTGVNTIKAGNLKVDLIDANSLASLEGSALDFHDINGNTIILWEPGATFETQSFKVKNAGDLAIKYEIVMNGMKVSDNKLMEVITLKIVDETTGNAIDLDTYVGHLKAGEESDAMKITATMKSTAGNAYQGLTATGMSITVFATQDAVEADINGTTYDEAATTDKNVVYVTTPDELVNAFANLKAGDVISLGADLDMTGKTIKAVTGNVGFTLNGNGKTISNLKSTERALFVAHSGSSAYFFNDVNLENCLVSSTTNYAALFVGDGDTSGNVTISNCNVTNCTVNSGKYAAMFVGYSSGYNVDTNGPVYGNFTITNCSVTGGSVTGGGSTAIAIAHAGGNKATTNIISGLTVSGVVIKGEDADHTGIVVGTAGVGITNISGITVGTGVTGNYNTAHEYYGRFVPSGSGKLTIDGVEQ